MISIIASYFPELTPDLLRLIIIPLFVYGAYLDYHTRRVYNEFWVPIIGLCFVFLGWDIVLLLLENSDAQSQYLFSFSLSLLVTPSLAYLLWENGFIGGADLKAIVILSVFFPTPPEILTNTHSHQFVEGITPIFTVTVIINALIISMAYQLKIGFINLKQNQIFNTHSLTVPTKTLDSSHGEIIVEKGTRVDLDILRMYLNWRNISLTELQKSPRFYQDTHPAVSQKTIDGAVQTRIKAPLHSMRNELSNHPTTKEQNWTGIANAFQNTDESNKWGVNQFFSETSITNTTTLSPEQFAQALDEITTKKSIMIEPSIPFFIPLTLSLIISVFYGSVLIGATDYFSQLLIYFFVQ